MVVIYSLIPKFIIRIRSYLYLVKSQNNQLSKLIKEFSRILSLKSNVAKTSNLYFHWINYNTSYYTKYYSLLAILIYALLIPFDFLLFDHPFKFTQNRIIVILILFCSLFFYHLKINNSYKKNNSDNYEFNFWLLLPSLLINIQYIYFLINATTNEYKIVLLAHFLVILISTLFMYKFRSEQILINFICIIILLIIPFSISSIGVDLNRLIIFHVISLGIALYYRNQFLDNLYKKYLHLSSLLPRRIALITAISDSKININKIFPTEQSYTVCLCSDWRNYQNLTKELSFEKLSKLTENFYDLVFERLDAIVPSGNYFVDWSADELFIIFYGKKTTNEQIRLQALDFSHTLATDIYLHISSTFDISLKFDIGLAAGNGLLGLQGPKVLKKTTLIGEVPGIAKRLESQAKSNRTSQKISNFPQIIMDTKLKSSSEKLDIFKNKYFTMLKGTEKNIEGNKYYLWQFSE